MRKSVSIEKLPKGYRVRYWALTPTGAYKKESEWRASYEEAQKFKAQKALSLRAKAQGFVDPSLRPIDIFREYLQALSRNPDYRQTTLDFKYDSLNTYIIGLSSMDQLGPKRFMDYLQTTTYGDGKHYSVNTIALRLRDLKSFNNWCVNEGYLENNLFTTTTADGKKNKFVIPAGTEVGRKLEIDEIKKLWEASSPKYRLFLAFLIYTGGRFGEISKTEWKHLDLDKGVWYIPKENNKTNRDKTIPLPDFVIELLKACPRADGNVFPKWNLRRYLYEAKEKAGIQGRLRPHDFRHTFASHWQGDTRKLMDQLGWTTAAMLKRYSHFRVEDIRKEAEEKGIAASLSLPA